jgi:hypothetical protein
MCVQINSANLRNTIKNAILPVIKIIINAYYIILYGIYI